VILGSWNPSVILTYLGTAVAVSGISLAGSGAITGAVACLVVVGLIDLADGPVARRVVRDVAARRFGVVIDTVADVVAFVALPVAILAALLPIAAAMALGALYAIAGLARLAHFTADQADPEGPVAHYRGLPVTYAALVLPLVALTKRLLPTIAFQGVLAGSVLILAAAFVVDVRVPKPRGVAYVVFGMMAVAVLGLLGVVGL
jgi:CDP-diacylglycerol--serine O-phosphatidyltransferase